jgi:uncharacterized membrane protein YbhN (UPF0104 family)
VTQPKVTGRRLLAGLLQIVVLGAFVWAIEHYWGWGRLLSPWSRVSLYLVIGVVLAQAASYSIRAFRIYQAEKEIPRGRYPDCLRLILINNMTNILLPARAGEASFPLLFKRWFGIDLAKGSGTLVWLRLLDLSVLAVLAVAVLGRTLVPSLPLALIVAAVIAGFFLPLLARPGQSVANRLLATRADGKVTRLIGVFLSGIPGTSRQVLIDLGLTWAAWVIKLAALAAAFFTLADISFPAGILGAIGGDLSTVLPIHAPGGFGTYEAGVVALASVLSKPGPELLAAAVNLHLLVLSIALVAGALAWVAPSARSKR